MKNNIDYKSPADLHRRIRTFNVWRLCDCPPETRAVFSGNREEITRAKRRTILNPQEDQVKCLCDGSPTKL